MLVARYATRRSIRRAMGAAIALLALSLPACGGGGGPTDPGGNNGGNNNGGNNNGGNNNSGPTASVSVNWGSFNPTSVPVAAGGTVTWTWNTCVDNGYSGESCATHNVTFDNAALGASASQSQGTWSRQFATRGTYGYHCTLHGTPTSGMRGSVVVQ